MKLIPTINLLFIFFTIPSFAETLEFRKFTLELGEEQKPLTVEQISHAVDAHQLGLNKAIKIEVKNSKFSYSDVTQVTYVATYGGDLKILDAEARNVGTSIQGTTKQVNDHLEVTFSYEHSSKIKDIVNGAKGKQVVLMPIFNHLKTSSTVTINRNNNQWCIVPIPSALNVATKNYIALRVRSKTLPRVEEIIWEKE